MCEVCVCEACVCEECVCVGGGACVCLPTRFPVPLPTGGCASAACRMVHTISSMRALSCLSDNTGDITLCVNIHPFTTRSRIHGDVEIVHVVVNAATSRIRTDRTVRAG